MCFPAQTLQSGSSIYQKQVAGLPALPADFHQGALLHKDLIKNTHELSCDTEKAFAMMNVVFKGSLVGDSQLSDCVKGNTGVVRGRQGGLPVSRQKQCCNQSRTLPGCSRSRWPRTLYSMLTRRNRFSWDTKQQTHSQTGRENKKHYRGLLCELWDWPKLNQIIAQHFILSNALPGAVLYV